MTVVRKLSRFSQCIPLLAVLPHLLLAQTTVTLSTSLNPSIFGAPVVLTATVTPATSNGRVTFFDGVNIVGIKPAASGAASLSTTLLSAGSHKLTAYYRDAVSSSTSNAITQTVKAIASATFLPQTTPGLTANSPVIADFNGDGKPDLVTPGQDSGSWWQVDLGASAAIGYIAIWNRTDCCASRLGDYWVFVSNTPFAPSDTPSTLQGRAGTFGSHQTTIPSPSATIPVNGTQGRYVRVQLSTPGYLSLAEVQVFGTGAQSATNLALGKAATQSSTFPGYTTDGAASAVDGNTDGQFFDGSVTSTSLNVVAISLGKGDGTFQPPVTSGAPQGDMAAGDFNGDGNTDLAFLGGGNVTILLGNGDGTFRQAGTSYPVFGPSAGPNLFVSGAGMVVGDFNGDGKADIIVGVSYTTIAGIITSGTRFSEFLLPGNGDGTFGGPVSYAPITAPFVMADFNGDGKPDLAGLTAQCGQPDITLGNGDGTSRTLSSCNTVGHFAAISVVSLLAGDFNGDGKTDLAGAGSIWLGNGDGTFQPPLSFSGTAAATGDFNGDGILDLVVGDSSGNLTGILYGNGDGTFHAGPALGGAGVLAVADFNGDGRADILTYGSGGVIVLLGSATSSAISLTASGGSGQLAPENTAFANPLQVTVKDGSGNPLSGIAVTFTVLPTFINGPSARLSSPSVTTDASGVASVTATANFSPGSYAVTAGVGSFSVSFSLTNVTQQFSGLALGKPATQSSTYPGYPSAVANSAVDGSTDGYFSDNSVTATNVDPNAWWQVDLRAAATINSIVIWNRVDCCGDRLSDYWVFVSNTPFLATDTPATLQNRPGTFASHQTTAPNPSATINVNGAQGHYVRVQLSGANILSLAEVQVFGTPVGPPPSNLAQGKTATQSSTVPGYPSAAASSAVDGNTDGAFFDGSVTATNTDNYAWWEVDLGASASISSVVIWNRTDCCGSRLSSYWVFISDTPFLSTDTPTILDSRGATYASFQGGPPSPSTTINFNAQGRYVRVQLIGTNNLSLAEVQVYGQ